jgi:hypothetical protein
MCAYDTMFRVDFEYVGRAARALCEAKSDRYIPHSHLPGAATASQFDYAIRPIDVTPQLYLPWERDLKKSAKFRGVLCRAVEMVERGVIVPESRRAEFVFYPNLSYTLATITLYDTHHDRERSQPCCLVQLHNSLPRAETDAERKLTEKEELKATAINLRNTLYGLLESLLLPGDMPSEPIYLAIAAASDLRPPPWNDDGQGMSNPIIINHFYTFQRIRKYEHRVLFTS